MTEVPGGLGPRESAVSGDRIRYHVSADQYNYELHGAELAQHTARNAPGPINQQPLIENEADICRVQNTTATDLERGDIIGLDAPLIAAGTRLESWWQHRAFLGVRPTFAPQWRHPGRIGILWEPIRAGAIGRVVVSGVAHVRLVIRDSNHEYADVDPLNGGHKLTTTDAGSACCQILEVEATAADGGTCGTENDTRWAKVRIQNGGAFTFVGKVTTAFSSFHCDSGVCPPKGKVQVYWLNPFTECLQTLIDRESNPVYVCPYNVECRPIPVDEWVRLHCDRYFTWWATPQEPVFAMLKAVDCIKPGDTTGTATVQKQGTAGYQDDPSYTEPVTVDNTDCLVMALPGELFPARREGCCTEKWIPDGPYGLTRRVRIDDCIDCSASGTATVLQSTCGGSGGGACGQSDADCSTITACNTSGRPIAPCGPEEAVAQLTPGAPADGKDCCWFLQAGPYPTRCKATLGSKLCPTDASGGVTGAEFPNFCKSDPEWPKPTIAQNPYGLAGCAGAAVELAPAFQGCECKWDIVQVKPVVREVLHDLRVSCESECKVEKQEYKEVLVWSCDDSVCDTPEWETLFTGTMVDVMADISTTCEGESGCSGKGLEKTYARVCVLCEGTAPSDGLIPFTSQTLTRLVKVAEGSECSDCKIRYETITLCGLWCEAGTGDTVAFTANPVDVLTDVSIDCDGIHKSTQKAYVLCACEGEESVSETTITTEVVAGDCISVSTADCKATVTNTMRVTGGDGITVSKSGCTYAVSLAGGGADPKVSLRVLCGVEVSPIVIECVESSGGWTFQTSGGVVTEKFTDITLPSSVVEYTSDCGGSGGSTSPPVTPVYRCDDCADCPIDEVKMMEVATGNCMCVHAYPDPVPPPGWVLCDHPGPPVGEGLTFNGLDCGADPPHVSFTFLGMPDGATHYVIEVVGDKGSSATLGPSGDHEEIQDQEYWGALVDGWGTPQPGEAFTFTVKFKDDAGNVISSQTYTATCP